MSAHLDHTLEVKRGLLLRLFLWVYEPRENRLNTCHLFWGFLFMPLALPLAVLAKGIGFLFRPLFRRVQARAAQSATRALAEHGVMTPKKEKKPSFLSKALPVVAGFFGKIWWYLQPILPWIGVALCVVGVAALVYTVVVFTGTILKVLLFLAICVAGAVAFVLSFIGLLMLFERFELGRAFKSGARAVHNHTCANIKIKD